VPSSGINPHGAMPQKTEFFIVTAVKTSNLKYCSSFDRAVQKKNRKFGLEKQQEEFHNLYLMSSVVRQTSQGE
jgi:hypothetical protein